MLKYNKFYFFSLELLTRNIIVNVPFVLMHSFDVLTIFEWNWLTVLKLLTGNSYWRSNPKPVWLYTYFGHPPIISNVQWKDAPPAASLTAPLTASSLSHASVPHLCLLVFSNSACQHIASRRLAIFPVREPPSWTHRELNIRSAWRLSRSIHDS